MRNVTSKPQSCSCEWGLNPQPHSLCIYQTGFLELGYPYSHTGISSLLPGHWGCSPGSGISTTIMRNLLQHSSDSPALFPQGTKLPFPCSGRTHLPQMKVLALSQAILRLIQYLLPCHPFQRLSWLFSTVTFSRLTPPVFNLWAALHSMDWCNFFPILKGSTKKSNFPW